MKNRQFQTIMVGVLIVFPHIGYTQVQPSCPVPPTQVAIKIASDVRFDKSKNMYTYTYTLTNSHASALPVNRFYVLPFGIPVSIEKPPAWLARFEENVANIPNRVEWLSATSPLAPGNTMGKFKLESKFPPGTVRYLVAGESELPSTVADETSDEPTPKCPGFFYGVAWAERFVTGTTTGPVSNDQVSAILKVGKISEKSHRQCMHISHKDKSRVKVTVYGSDTLNVADIDISSLKFGPGEAKPLSTKIIPFEDDVEHEKPRDGKKAIKQPKMLRMEFSIADLKLRCNLDHALFLSGKVGLKNLFGGVEVEPDVCTVSDVQKKPKKIHKDRI